MCTKPIRNKNRSEPSVSADCEHGLKNYNDYSLAVVKKNQCIYREGGVFKFILDVC